MWTTRMIEQLQVHLLAIAERPCDWSARELVYAKRISNALQYLTARRQRGSQSQNVQRRQHTR